MKRGQRSSQNFSNFRNVLIRLIPIFTRTYLVEMEIALKRRGLPVDQTHKSPDNAHDRPVFFTILAINAIIVVPSSSRV